MDQWRLCCYHTKTRSGEISAHDHGFSFNPSGDKAAGANYWFDTPDVGLYEFGGDAMHISASKVYPDNGDGTFGSFSSYATWGDSRYAYVVIMQLGSTSLSGNMPVSGPGIYLIDAGAKAATMVAGTPQNKNNAGKFQNSLRQANFQISSMNQG